MVDEYGNIGSFSWDFLQCCYCVCYMASLDSTPHHENRKTTRRSGRSLNLSSLKPKYRTRSYPNAPSSSSSSPSDVFLLSKQRCRRRCPVGPSSPRRHARTREALTNECDNSWVGTAGGVSEWTVRQGRGNAMQHLSDRLRASEWRNLTCVVITEVDEEVSNGIIHIETDTDLS